ncbi:MAG: PhoH family protein, partial [Myxococcales bacterium]
MKKNFILDTNVLLHDPRALFAFEENNVIIPIYVIEEIDTFKRDLSELGRNARQVARYLDGLREKGQLGNGVALENGATIKVLFTERQLPPEMVVGTSTDNRILAVALDARDTEPETPTIFVTKDANLRIRADALGLVAEDYDAERVEITELYTGFNELFVPPEKIDGFYKNGEAEVELPEHGPNQFVLLKDERNPSHSAMGKFSAQRGPGRVVPVTRIQKEGVWGIRPRNMEQSFALDMLLNDEIKLVTIVGKAGTGKTLLAIAAGLQKTMEESVYSKLLVSRPIFPLGRDIGYLPGDVEEKLNPWMQPIFDNVEFLMNISRADKKAGRGYHELMDLGILEIEPLTYIRGRSIPNQYIIVDEAQNLTPHEVKTIIT